jgi:TonB-linked SusC/RagA family outer membrane protein
MKNFFKLMLLFTVLPIFELLAQQKISGTVKSSKDSQAIAGVSIQVKGTNAGTLTDQNGAFSLLVNSKNTLVFSFVGYKKQEVTVGDRTTFSIVLEEDTQALEEVVVTALGIKKESKKLGYATSTIAGAALTENRTPNFMNSLTGKVPGVNISSLSTGPAGSSKIRIRGQSSFSGQNSPLIVINGVPMDNTNFGSNPGNRASDNSQGLRATGGNTATADGGDGLSSINPDDIENMTVLKGATAAALYGSRAKDGVIMVTTKTKGSGKGIGVSYNMNYTNETPLDFTDYQRLYGQGERGLGDPATTKWRPQAANPTSGQWSFGDKFAPGMTQILFNGVEVPYEAQPSHISKFYRNGMNLTNTVSISSGSDKGGFNLSVANMDSKGITPNNKYNRKTINLGFNYNIGKKLTVSGNTNYSNEKNTNPPNIANQDNSIPTTLMNLSTSMPLELMEKFYINPATDREYIYSRFQNRTNPYFVLNKQKQNIIRDRLFGNVTARYSITDWLSVLARVGQDYYSRDQDVNYYPTGHNGNPSPPAAGFVDGNFVQESRRFRETNADVLVQATKKFGDIELDVNVGGNQMYRRSDQNFVSVTDFVVKDLYTVQNGRLKDPFYSLEERKVNSVYGSAELSYKNFLFVNATARNDWFSTLSPENRSILYPSVSGSFVFSQALQMPKAINFGKIRAAFAEVGSDTDVPPYSSSLYYGVNSTFLNGAIIGGSAGNVVPNANLRPMRASEKEIGLELRMFNSRVNLDAAIYEKVTSDQIVSAQISDASGFSNTLINSGKGRNRGVEMLLTLVPVRTKDFSWELGLNGAYNITKALSLLTDDDGTAEKDYNKDKQAERITTGVHIFNGEQRIVVGQELGLIYGYGYKRDANGAIIHNASGIPIRTPDLINWGSSIHKWTGGITNSFNYKGISVSALVDFKLGGKMLSGTNFNAIRHGLHKMTLPGRDEFGITGVGVTEAGEVNKKQASPIDYWSVVRSQQIIEPAVFNAGFWKLRQITAGYDFTKFLPKNSRLQGVRLSLVANNVLLLKKWVDNIDPESFGYTSDNISGMESTGLPTTRSVGFNLNVKF